MGELKGPIHWVDEIEKLKKEKIGKLSTLAKIINRPTVYIKQAETKAEIFVAMYHVKIPYINKFVMF